MSLSRVFCCCIAPYFSHLIAHFLNSLRFSSLIILIFSAMQANADAVTLAKTSEGNNTLSWNFADANTFPEVFEKKDGGKYKLIDTQGGNADGSVGSIAFKNKANGTYTYKLDGCYTGRDTPICSRRIVLTASTRVGPQRPSVPKRTNWSRVKNIVVNGLIGVGGSAQALAGGALDWVVPLVLCEQNLE